MPFTTKQSDYHSSLRKLTDEQIAQLYNLYYAYTTPTRPTMTALAKLFNVSQSCIFKTLNTEHLRRTNTDVFPSTDSTQTTCGPTDTDTCCDVC